jgi:hypothetical protein
MGAVRVSSRRSLEDDAARISEAPSDVAAV